MAAVIDCSRRAGTSLTMSVCMKTSDRSSESSAAEPSRRSATSPSTDRDTLWPTLKTARGLNAANATRVLPNVSTSE